MFCLRAETDAAWAAAAVQDLDAVLVDHAHCEMKAATNALSLVVRHSGDLGLVKALSEIAREELAHFERVVEFLEQRGLRLGPPPVDDYAAELRRAMTELPMSELPVLVDRLLVGALIEARSCERFKLLQHALPDTCPTDLREFYAELFAAEARHYRDYVELAIRAARGVDGGPVRVESRLEELARVEAKIVRSLAERQARGTMHG
jgi:tRNA-(ms[2]io[6]A)-hydroxylase